MDAHGHGVQRDGGSNADRQCRQCRRAILRAGGAGGTDDWPRSGHGSPVRGGSPDGFVKGGRPYQFVFAVDESPGPDRGLRALRKRRRRCFDAHWGQLQESLARQNVQLLPLENKPAFANPSFDPPADSPKNSQDGASGSNRRPASLRRKLRNPRTTP